MRISEILSELTFQGSTCTKDCSGHSAGYRWAMSKNTNNCNSLSSSFNKGCNIAIKQKNANKIVRPKVRTPQGQFAPNPKI